MRATIFTIIILSIITFVLGYHVLFTGSTLPSAEDITNITIVYNEVSGELQTESTITKRFEISTPVAIKNVRGKIGDVKVGLTGNVTTDEMDKGENWIINMYFKGGDFRFIYIDRNSPSKGLYDYLKKHHT